MSVNDNWSNFDFAERKMLVLTSAHIGIFINDVNEHDLWFAISHGQNGLILNQTLVDRLENRSLQVPAGLTNRLIAPVDGCNPQQICHRAEALTLTAENVWVQVPVMTAGRFNGQMIRKLLSEGVPLTVAGIASKQQVYRLLTIASAYSTPLLLKLCSEMTRYDVIVSVALAHLLPQVQVISQAWSTDEFWDLQEL